MTDLLFTVGGFAFLWWIGSDGFRAIMLAHLVLWAILRVLISIS